MPSLFDALAVEITGRMHDFNALQVANIAWAFATLGHESPVLFEAIKTTLPEHVTELDAQGLANVAWAFAKAGHKAPRLFEALSREAAGRVHEFIPQGLTNIAWAFAKARHEDPVLLERLAGEAIGLVRDFNCQDTANTLWAFAKAQYKAPKLFEAFATELLGHVHKLKPRELATVAWAFAKAGEEAPALFQALAGETLAGLSSFNSQNIANIAWAFATLGHKEPKFFKAIAVEVASRACEFTPQGLANTAWAFTMLEQDLPLLLESELREASLGLHEPRDGEIPLEVADLFTALHNELLRRSDEFAPTPLLALHWTYANTRLLCNSFRQQFVDCAMRLGQKKDDEADPGGRKKLSSKTYPAALGDEPLILSEAGHWMTLYKPPFWSMAVNSADEREALADGLFADEDELEEQDGRQSKTTENRQIHGWLNRCFEDMYPICGDPIAQHGLAHRLDVETSGTLLCAKSYTGQYWLRMQWCDDKVDKEYICLVHGWIDPSLREINKRIRIHKSISQHTTSSHCEISSSGKPSQTELVTLAHLVKVKAEEDIKLGSSTDGRQAVKEQETQEDRYSLVAVKLHTGRTHQIRVHMLSIGHPLVCDYKYAVDHLPSDQNWCKRNFLHTYRLGFEDVPEDGSSRGSIVDMTCPLPSDLRMALGTLKHMDDRAEKLQADWLSGESKRILDFKTYAGGVFGADAVVERTKY